MVIELETEVACYWPDYRAAYFSRPGASVTRFCSALQIQGPYDPGSLTSDMQLGYREFHGMFDPHHREDTRVYCVTRGIASSFNTKGWLPLSTEVSHPVSVIQSDDSWGYEYSDRLRQRRLSNLLPT